MLSLSDYLRRTWVIIDGTIQNRRSKTYMECIPNNYTEDFLEGIEIENQEEYMKIVTVDKQAEDDSDWNHVIDDGAIDMIYIDHICNTLYFFNFIVFLFRTNLKAHSLVWENFWQLKALYNYDDLNFCLDFLVM